MGYRAWASGLIGSLLLVTQTLADTTPPGGGLAPRVKLIAQPLVLTVSTIGASYDIATVTDVEIADFDLDGRNDIAVAWYATDLDNYLINKRSLDFFFGEGNGTFSHAVAINLYVPDLTVPALSVFRNGTSEIAQGDFDGDGDVDLAVMAYFGDELWFIENLGNRSFTTHLRFPFGYNSPGNFITPPESAAADFDGDGRDELVYIADPILQIEGQIIHFWKTAGRIKGMQRVYWEGIDGSVYTQWTRALAIEDFDGDGLPDLCFTGTNDPPYESNPVLTFWYGLDPGSGWFNVHREYPSILCSDVAACCHDDDSLPGFVLTDLNGTTMQHWVPSDDDDDDDDLAYEFAATVSGYAGLAYNRGMTAVLADLDGDGLTDLVTKQKLGGEWDTNQVEVTLRELNGAAWSRVVPNPLDSSGFRDVPYSQILRPRNLAVGDLLGNTLPEIVAGFSMTEPSLRVRTLEIAVWLNSCPGDANSDGRSGAADFMTIVAAYGSCQGDGGFNPDADLNKDGCIDGADFDLLLEDAGCACRDDMPWECISQPLADANCDGVVNDLDLDAFLVAVSAGEDAWGELYGGLGCSFECTLDLNGNGRVNAFDLDLFLNYIMEETGSR